MVLWRLRNAPYARHGRAFKMTDLHKFFYDTVGLTVDRTFKESMLDRTDKANVTLVVQAINKQLGLPDASAYAFCQGRCSGHLEPGDCADLCSLTRENMSPASSSRP